MSQQNTPELSEPLHKALVRVVQALQGLDGWALTGSVGFRLQGVPVNPHDIDVQTTAKGAYEVEKRLLSIESLQVVRKVVFSRSEAIQSHYGSFLITDLKTEVEVMGDVQKHLDDGRWEEPANLALLTRQVIYQGMVVPVLDLEYEYLAYVRMGRHERAQLLRKWLDSQDQ